MTIYAIGTEAFTWDFCSAIDEASNGFDTIYSGRGPAMYVDAQATLLTGTPVSELWARFNLSTAGLGSITSVPVVSLMNSSTDKDALRIIRIADTEFEVFYNSSGTTYTSVGTFYFSHLSSYGGSGYGNCLNLYFKRGGSGVVKVFVNDTVVFSYSGAMNTVDSTFDGLRFRGSDDVRAFNIGSVILSSNAQFNTRLATLRPSGIGNESGWSLNTFSNVDDAAFKTDFEDGNYTNSAGVACTHAMSDITAMTDRIYSLVVGYAHAALASGATPTAMNFRVRQGSTNYTKGSFGVTAGEPPTRFREFYTTDMLGNAWTSTNINGLHFGVITS